MARLLDISSNFDQLARTLNDLERTQLPYATALATTGVARRIAAAEAENLSKVLDRPTPFTVKSVRLKGATKANPSAVVTMGPVAGQYLEPYLKGGTHFLGGKRGLLVPKAQRTNQYGNLPKGKLAQLKAQQGVFVGQVRIGGRLVNGVWQRTMRTKHTRTKGVVQTIHAATGQLKLLIRFEDPLPVHQTLGWFDIPNRVVATAIPAEFGAAMTRALATAR